MAYIHRLPPDLANQIAAGEVVERPASVVKELLENAIDAGATRISVTVELGGKKSIRVEDDGRGMSREDAELSLERHATSKIRTAADLGAITSLGFRGEALPSIASVSHLRLLTRARGEPGGTEIRVDAGVIASVRDAGAAEGTVVEVGDLFYNLPARRKFLKSDAAEAAQISRLLTQMALAFPEIGFTLVSGTRRLLQCPPVSAPADRFYQLFGERPDLVEVRKEAAGIRVWGLVAALAEQGPVKGPQHVFVNRRIVKDRTIAHAIIDAYSTATIKERSPEVHLFIEMPPDRVDVNVHPTKAEVRFLEQSVVHEVLRRALIDTLGRSPAPALQLRAGEVRPSPPLAPGLPGVVGRGAGAAGWQATTPLFRRDAPVAGVVEGNARVGAEGGGGEEVAIRPMTPLGQFRNTFIVAIDEDGVAIVDQHVAHERVLFEQVMERLASGRLESQRLLAPLVLELSPAQLQTLSLHAADLDRLGFAVEEFGGKSLRVGAVPALLGLDEAAATVRALGEDLEGLDRGARAEEALRRIAATTACHAAVKANDPLTPEKMRYILDELRRTAHSTVCPHGRPVVLRLTRREIEKNFQRI